MNTVLVCIIMWKNIEMLPLPLERKTLANIQRKRTCRMKLRSSPSPTRCRKRKFDPGSVKDYATGIDSKKGKTISDLFVEQLLVSFVFGPPELNRLSFVIKRLQHLMTFLKRKIPEHIGHAKRILLCHHSSLKTKDVCLLSFDSIPSEEMLTDVSEVNDTVVVCYVDEKLVKEKGSREFIQQLMSSTSKENFFLIHNLPECMPFENVLYNWRIHVDANHIIPIHQKKSRIFKRMYHKLDGILHSVLADLKKLPEGIAKENALKTFACIEKKWKESKNYTGLSKDCKELLESGQNFGIIAYRTDGENLTVYTNQPETRTLNAKLKELREKCSPLSLRHLRVQTPIYRRHHLTAGSKLENLKSNLLGTLGTFAKKVKENLEKDVAITSAHVIWEGCTAKSEINGEEIEIGTCTWPPEPNDHMDARINDMALVELNSEVTGKIYTSKNICLYDGPKEDLDCQPVLKKGYTTGESEGDIEDPQFSLYGSTVMIITRADKEKFSEPGDSGALVLTQKGSKLFALGLIFGGDLNLRESDDEFPENASIAIYLDEAIQNFEKESENETIKLDRF